MFGVFGRDSTQAAPRAVESASAALLPAVVRGYARLVIAPKDPRSRTFAGRVERFAREAEGMSDDAGFAARARERLEAEVDDFADAQRKEIDRTIATLEAGLRTTANRLEDALRAGDSAASTMGTARYGLGALDRVTSFEALRSGLDAEIRRLDEAIKLHARATADARAAMEGEVAHLRARLGEARELASRDALTGLANRSEFDRRLQSVPNPQRHAVAVIDLDGFKPINDRFGHGAGDHVLAEYARRLLEAIGRRALVARVGGDEFAVLAQDSEAHLTTRLRTLEHSLKEEPIRSGDVVLPLGMSFGVAAFEGADPSRSVAIADGRMYHYKRAKGTQRAA